MRTVWSLGLIFTGVCALALPVSAEEIAPRLSERRPWEAAEQSRTTRLQADSLHLAAAPNTFRDQTTRMFLRLEEQTPCLATYARAVGIRKAQTEGAQPNRLPGKWSLSLGGFSPYAVPDTITSGLGITVKADYAFYRHRWGEAGVSLRYSNFPYYLKDLAWRGNETGGLLNPMIEYRLRPGTNSKALYFGLSLGGVFSIQDRIPGQSSGSFAYGFCGGYDRGPYFAELGFIDGTGTMLRGFTFSAGIRFK
jgi:hypothetical protein